MEPWINPWESLQNLFIKTWSSGDLVWDVQINFLIERLWKDIDIYTKKTLDSGQQSISISKTNSNVDITSTYTRMLQLIVLVLLPLLIPLLLLLLKLSNRKESYKHGWASRNPAKASDRSSSHSGAATPIYQEENLYESLKMIWRWKLEKTVIMGRRLLPQTWGSQNQSIFSD